MGIAALNPSYWCSAVATLDGGLAFYANAFSAQRDHRPAAFCGGGAQAVVGVDGHWVADLFQQRQIVARVAVEGAAVQGAVVLGQPVLQAGDLAGLVARNVGGAPGVAAVSHFAFGGQQRIDAQARGNRRGNEAVGGGDDQQLVARRAVLGQQRLALGQDDRLDAVAHKLAVPLLKLGH